MSSVPSTGTVLPDIQASPVKKSSNLPSWFLKSTAAVQASKQERGRVEVRILGVKKDALLLENLIDTNQEKYALRLKDRAAAEAGRLHRIGDEGTVQDDGSASGWPRLRVLGLHTLPDELTALTAEYLCDGAKELTRCSLTCKGALTYFAPEEGYFEQEGHFNSNGDGSSSIWRQRELRIGNGCSSGDGTGGGNCWAALARLHGLDAWDWNECIDLRPHAARLLPAHTAKATAAAARRRRRRRRRKKCLQATVETEEIAETKYTERDADAATTAAKTKTAATTSPMPRKKGPLLKISSKQMAATAATTPTMKTTAERSASAKGGGKGEREGVASSRSGVGRGSGGGGNSSLPFIDPNSKRSSEEKAWRRAKVRGGRAASGANAASEPNAPAPVLKSGIMSSSTMPNLPSEKAAESGGGAHDFESDDEFDVDDDDDDNYGDCDCARARVCLHAQAVAKVKAYVVYLKYVAAAAAQRTSTRTQSTVHDNSNSDHLKLSTLATIATWSRSKALQALELCVLVTANALDGATLPLLRRAGAVSVMAGLLSSESGVVAELACASLANLLCTTCSEAAHQKTCVKSGSSGDCGGGGGGGMKNKNEEHDDPRLAVERTFNGKEGLVALLSSPSARLNTLTSMPLGVVPSSTASAATASSTSDSSSPLNSSVSSAHSSSQQGVEKGQRFVKKVVRHTTTFSIGMSSKHASRALCNLWCPSEVELPASMLEHSHNTPWLHEGARRKRLLLKRFNRLRRQPRQRGGDWDSFDKRNNEEEVEEKEDEEAAAQMLREEAIKEADEEAALLRDYQHWLTLLTSGRDFGEANFGTSRGENAAAGVPLVVVPPAVLLASASSSSSAVMAMSIQERHHARLLCVGRSLRFAKWRSTWMAYYFYRTGTEKDVSTVELALFSDGTIEGRGGDNLGAFAVLGAAQAVRTGCLTYTFKKTYIDRGASSVPLDGHISHVAFWSGPDQSKRHDNSINDNGNENDDVADDAEAECCEVFGSGFWGVWELVTGVPHFELEKGGVFRLVPLGRSAPTCSSFA